jgi:hypothetical protein
MSEETKDFLTNMWIIILLIALFSNFGFAALMVGAGLTFWAILIDAS